MANLISGRARISTAKADKGYAGPLTRVLSESSTVSLECVKSNFGTPEFIPIDGRWVVERTFPWLENYRRVCRNYEKLLRVARHMATAACVCIMLKYFL
ncbi:MAG: transposase [Paramuribaculum sp.]